MILKEYEYNSFNKIKEIVLNISDKFKFKINYGNPNFYFIYNDNVEIVYLIENDNIRFSIQNCMNSNLIKTVYIDNRSITAEDKLILEIKAIVSLIKNKDNIINIKDVKEKSVSFMPSKIKFNSKEEFYQFERQYNEVLGKRRDWYFNSKTLIFCQ